MCIRSFCRLLPPLKHNALTTTTIESQKLDSRVQIFNKQ